MQFQPAEVIFQQLTQAFAASQDFTRQEVRRRQIALLERLVRHARTHVPFYADGNRLKPLFRADGSFDLRGWNDIPILTRNEAHEHEAALRAREIPPDMGAQEIRSTSGSTGIPLKFSQTDLQRIASEVLLNRTLRWHKLWPIEVLAFVSDTMTSVPMPQRMVILPGHLTFEKHVELLRSHRVTHALVAPNIAHGWAAAVEARDLPCLTTIITTGEVLRAEVRQRIQQKLKVKVINLYSASEIGPLASEGADNDFCINEEIGFLEGSAAAARSQPLSRVVVTPFYAYGMPLIRYAPGDYVRFSKAEARRARGLRRLEEIVGRQRSLFRRPDGELFLPGRFVARRLEAILDCRQWQLVQTSLADVVLKIVVAEPPTPRQRDALEAYLRECLPKHRTSIAVVDSIENDMQKGKAYEMFLCLADE